MLMNIALSISRNLHIDSSSPIAVEIVRVKSIIAGDLISSRQTAKIHPHYNMDARDLKVSISVMSIIMRIDLKIDDLISLITNVVDVVRAMLYSLL